MLTRFALILVFLGLSGAETLSAAETGQIVGQLADTRGQITYSGEAVVFLCDAKTGYPIHRETKRPIQISYRDLPLDKLWYQETKVNGSFEFTDVPVGEYRLVAESWAGTKGLPKIPGDVSATVTLNGVAEKVVVEPGQRTVAFPRQLGNGVLHIANDPEEGHAFLLISLKPTLGDGILGPLGWGEEFVSHIIGVTYMEQPQVTICGLPDKQDVHVGLFNIDNNPGVGAGSYQAGQREGQLRIVASWSNGHHEPPPELKELTDKIENSKLTLSDFLDESDRAKTAREQGVALWNILQKTPKREVEVPELGQRRLADVAAALAYIKLRNGLPK